MLIIILLISIYIFIGFYVYKKFYKVFGWTHPLIWLYFYGLINYPIRAIILMLDGYSRVMPKLIVNGSTVGFALVYALLFMILRCVFVKKYKQDISNISETTALSISNALKVYKVFSVLCIFIEVYLIATGRLYTLGENFGTKESGFIEMLTGFQDFNYFYIFLGIYCFKYDRKNIFVKITLIFLISYVILRCVVSTSKGDMVNLFSIYIICSTILNFKIKPYYIVSFVSIAILFALYSYFVRYYGVVSGLFTFKDLVNNFDVFVSSYSTVTSAKSSNLENIFSALDRFYYLDPIIYMNNFSYKSSPYDLGSIRDIMGLIPRAVWIDKPQDFNFGIFLGKSLWQFSNDSLIEMPIGRIGETFYLFKWGGLILVPFLVFIQNVVFEKLFVKGDIILKSMYFFVFFAMINGDSGWIFYSYRNVILGLIFCYLIRFILKIKLKKQII